MSFPVNTRRTSHLPDTRMPSSLIHQISTYHKSCSFFSGKRQLKRCHTILTPPRAADTIGKVALKMGTISSYIGGLKKSLISATFLCFNLRSLILEWNLDKAGAVRMFMASLQSQAMCSINIDGQLSPISNRLAKI